MNTADNRAHHFVDVLVIALIAARHVVFLLNLMTPDGVLITCHYSQILTAVFFL